MRTPLLPREIRSLTPSSDLARRPESPSARSARSTCAARTAKSRSVRSTPWELLAPAAKSRPFPLDQTAATQLFDETEWCMSVIRDRVEPTAGRPTSATTQKRPTPVSGARVAKGQNQTHALQHNGTVKYVQTCRLGRGIVRNDLVRVTPTGGSD